MVFLPLVPTLLLSLGIIAQASSIHGNAIHHRAIAERMMYLPGVLVERQLVTERRRSCKAHVSSSISSKSPTTSPIKAAPTTTTATPTTQPTTKPTDSGSGSNQNSDTGSKPPSGSGPTGGHQFTLTNKCSNAVKPIVASTACGYSPRCSDASTAALPSVGSLGPGQTTTISIPNNFVGRIFAQNGKCGAKGEDCTMLEFNLDADSFYTPNSYDISNIQGFTQSISLGAEGCPTVTCTNPSCSCDNAYAIGDMTGCGKDLPVKACGKGNKAFTVVFCP